MTIRRFEFEQDFTPRKFAFADDGDEAGGGGSEDADDKEIVLDGEGDKSADDDKGKDDADDDGKGKDDAIKGTTKEEADDDAAKAGPPKEYEFQGLDGEVAEAKDVKEFSDWARGVGLSQEQAQKILTGELENQKEGADKAQADFDEVTAGWRKAARADKHEEFPIGGDHFDEAVGNANRFIKAYGTPELVSALGDTGMKNHPEIIRAFARAGKEVAEDTLESGGSRTDTQSLSTAAVLYPKAQ